MLFQSYVEGSVRAEGAREDAGGGGGGRIVCYSLHRIHRQANDDARVAVHHTRSGQSSQYLSSTLTLTLTLTVALLFPNEQEKRYLLTNVL